MRAHFIFFFMLLFAALLMDIRSVWLPHVSCWWWLQRGHVHKQRATGSLHPHQVVISVACMLSASY